MSKEIICHMCSAPNLSGHIYCSRCGSFLMKNEFQDSSLLEEYEFKMKRLVGNLNEIPHLGVQDNELLDSYIRNGERIQAMLSLGCVDFHSSMVDGQVDKFLKACREPEFQIAFVGTIKTGKSTLINALLGRNYASISVTPETAVLTKFRSSERDYVRVIFYSSDEWSQLWDSVPKSAYEFLKEYRELDGESEKDKWVGHDVIYKELDNHEIESQLSDWTSSKSPIHYFVKEVEVGISTLPQEFPRQVVFVDTPGLSDPVVYRSDITKRYIKDANAVFVCVDAQKIYKEEVETISAVFSFSSHNPEKVHIIATHWDMLNSPVEDWEEQKIYMVKKLTGEAFFGTSEMAHSNIMPSAAYIYNLCRDYNRLTTKEKKPLFRLAINFDFEDPMELTDGDVKKLMDLSNVEAIRKTIKTKLVANYVKFLQVDLQKQYDDIIFKMQRDVKRCREDLAGRIKATELEIQGLHQRLDAKKRAQMEIEQCKQQLVGFLNSVEKNINVRLRNVSKELESMI